jgi:Domain of unknown function (DUF4157)
MRSHSRAAATCACGGIVGPDGQCERCRRERVGRTEQRLPSAVKRALAAPGRPLEDSTRAIMESRLRYDVRDVRIHSDATADAAARAVDAVALTVGPSVVFAAGRYQPETPAGRRLLAHELAHVVQQRLAGSGTAPSASQRHEAEAERAAAGLPTTLSAAAGIQLQGASPCPTRIDFSSKQPVHTPPCGTFSASANVRGVKWSLEADPTTVDPTTTIAANGAITLGAKQQAGQIKVVAEGASGCTWERPLTIRSNPTGIASTKVVSRSSTDYGGFFDHVFTSADGNVASLENVAVGEQFIGVPTPTAATHAIGPPTYPFGGTFTLSTATLTPDATNNWFLTAKGELGGTHDEVTIGKSGINVGLFVASASNPKPVQALPATVALSQGLHWFCPQAPAASRWRTPPFVTVAHNRTLRETKGVVEFVTSVNNVDIVDPYAGPVAVFRAVAVPATAAPSPAAPAAPNTVRIAADTLPATLPTGARLNFTFVGSPHGCTLARDPKDAHAATLTIGRTKGAVTVRIADATGRNVDQVTVPIA